MCIYIEWVTLWVGYSLWQRSYVPVVVCVLFRNQPTRHLRSFLTQFCVSIAKQMSQSCRRKNEFYILDVLVVHVTYTHFLFCRTPFATGIHSAIYIPYVPVFLLRVIHPVLLVPYRMCGKSHGNLSI